MDNNSVNISVTSAQVILALLFQMWLVVFPVIIIIKLNHLTRRIDERFGPEEEEQNV
jgi:hypothetical protein